MLNPNSRNSKRSVSLVTNLARLALLMFCVTILGDHAFATSYYVSYTHGSDSNAGTSTSAPWQHAPGMNDASGLAASTKVNPGDSVILQGCVTWPNAAFSWEFPYSGSSGNPIYVGVDKTWWDNTVSGCSSSWNRPVFNLGDAPPTDSLYRIILLNTSYVNYDNFEITNIAALPSSGNGSTGVFAWFAGSSNTNVTVEDMYVHGWVNPYFSIGTGNLTSGSCTITNYVPYSYSTNLPTSAWGSSGKVQVQSLPQGEAGIPEGNNTPTVTAISGSNPYTVTFTNTAGCATENLTGAIIQLGGDFLQVTEGVEGTCTQCIMQNNVIDGSDTAEAQLNPYGDCGATESNNQFCVTSADAGWRQPNIWRGNVIQYVSSAFVGECSEWSNNLIQDLRLSTNPTTHTNAIECLDETASNNLYYNNVERHTNNPNAKVPGGQWSIGLFNQVTPMSGYTDYVFNNVTYDGLQNVPWGLFAGGNGCCGSLVFFNNTGDGGPSWTSQSYDLINKCPSAYKSCTFENDDLISNLAASSSALTNCGSNCTESGNLVESLSTASGESLTSGETYAYAPLNNTAETETGGAATESFCSAVTAINAAAGAACVLDTSYGVGYNTTTHTVITPGRQQQVSRPTGSAAWNRGAYQWGPAPPALSGSVTSK